MSVHVSPPELLWSINITWVQCVLGMATFHRPSLPLCLSSPPLDPLAHFYRPHLTHTCTHKHTPTTHTVASLLEFILPLHPPIRCRYLLIEEHIGSGLVSYGVNKKREGERNHKRSNKWSGHCWFAWQDCWQFLHQMDGLISWDVESVLHISWSGFTGIESQRADGCNVATHAVKKGRRRGIFFPW